VTYIEDSLFSSKTYIIAIGRPILCHTLVGKSKLFLEVTERKDGLLDGVPQLGHAGLVISPSKESEKT